MNDRPATSATICISRFDRCVISGSSPIKSSLLLLFPGHLILSTHALLDNRLTRDGGPRALDGLTHVPSTIQDRTPLSRSVYIPRTRHVISPSIQTLQPRSHPARTDWGRQGRCAPSLSTAPCPFLQHTLSIANLKHAREMIKRAAGASPKPDLVVLPVSSVSPRSYIAVFTPTRRNASTPCMDT